MPIPKGWHIHHVDGNHENNDPLNLICVSPYVHWCIHFLQGHPFAAAQGFITVASEKRAAAGSKGMRVANKNMFSAGTHPSQRGTSGFWTMDVQKRRESGLKGAQSPSNPFVSGAAGRASKESPNAAYKHGRAGFQVTCGRNADRGRRSSQQKYRCARCDRVGRGSSMKYHADKQLCARPGYRFYGRGA